MKKVINFKVVDVVFINLKKVMKGIIKIMKQIKKVQANIIEITDSENFLKVVLNLLKEVRIILFLKN